MKVQSNRALPRATRLVALGALVGCMTAAMASPAAAVTLRFGHVLPTTHPWVTCGVETMQASLAQRPELEIDLQVFPGAQLGSNEEMVESVAQGSLDMTLPGVGSVSPFYAPFGVLEAFFAFKDLAHLKRVWSGEIGGELREGAEAEGLHVIGDLWYIGQRQITANKLVSAPGDLEGVSMRSQDTPASFANIRALGANPTPIAYGELYLALSQGVVDAEENPIANVLSAKFFEVQDYMSVTNHALQMGALLVNQNKWSELSDEQRAALEEAANTAAAKVQGCIEEQEVSTLEQWRQDSTMRMKIIDDVDRDAFAQKALEFFAGPEGPEWKDWYTRVQSAP